MTNTAPYRSVSVSHWVLMASEMASGLEEIIRENQVSGHEFNGELEGAREYMDDILANVAGIQKRDELACLEAFDCASDILRASLEHALPSWTEVGERIRYYRSFLDQLEAPRNLTPEDVLTAVEIHRFFLGLAIKAADADAREVASLEPSSWGQREVHDSEIEIFESKKMQDLANESAEAEEMREMAVEPGIWGQVNES